MKYFLSNIILWIYWHILEGGRGKFFSEICAKYKKSVKVCEMTRYLLDFFSLVLNNIHICKIGLDNQMFELKILIFFFCTEAHVVFKQKKNVM